MIKTDVIILGSGIAGLVLSVLLKRKKINHIVLDRIQKQKSLALAETLPPSALVLLEELELLEDFKETALKKTYGYHAIWGSSVLKTVDFFNNNPFKYGLKLDKEATLKRLKNKVDEHLIPYKQIVSMAHSEKEIKVTVQQKAEQETVSGKWIIDATGRNRALLQALKITEKTYDDLMAFSCHVQLTEHPQLIHQVYTEAFEHGWGIVSSLSEKEQAMTLFTSKAIGIHQKISLFSSWKNVLSDTKYLKTFLSKNSFTKVLGKKANTTAASQFAGNNWLAIGDAAFTFDPLSSHGISNAIYTAKKAADVLTDDTYKPKTYNADLKAIFNSYLASKKNMYASETRWANSEFWKE